MSASSYARAFLDLLFPTSCLACGGLLEEGEESICSVCRVSLPRTDSHLHPQKNSIAEKFWGRVSLNFAIAYLQFRKNTISQTLLHKLKYENHPEIGYILGKWYAAELSKGSLLQNIDVIIPIPLHSKKLKKRGYNQSLYFAKGLSEILNIPYTEKAFQKIINTTSQTKKDRIERLQNLEGSFQTTDNHLIKERNILLVDDVITTGATLEACAELLLQSGAVSVSVATIAVAQT